MLVEGDDVDAAGADARQRSDAVAGVLDLETLPVQPALHQVGKVGVVIDVKEGGAFCCHAAVGGTWMTEKNRPSWRMALAKLS